MAEKTLFVESTTRYVFVIKRMYLCVKSLLSVGAYLSFIELVGYVDTTHIKVAREGRNSVSMPNVYPLIINSAAVSKGRFVTGRTLFVTNYDTKHED